MTSAFPAPSSSASETAVGLEDRLRSVRCAASCCPPRPTPSQTAAPACTHRWPSATCRTGRPACRPSAQTCWPRPRSPARCQKQHPVRGGMGWDPSWRPACALGAAAAAPTHLCARAGGAAGERAGQQAAADPWLSGAPALLYGAQRWALCTGGSAGVAQPPLPCAACAEAAARSRTPWAAATTPRPALPPAGPGAAAEEPAAPIPPEALPQAEAALQAMRRSSALIMSPEVRFHADGILHHKVRVRACACVCVQRCWQYTAGANGAHSCSAPVPTPACARGADLARTSWASCRTRRQWRQRRARTRYWQGASLREPMWHACAGGCLAHPPPARCLCLAA